MLDYLHLKAYEILSKVQSAFKLSALLQMIVSRNIVGAI